MNPINSTAFYVLLLKFFDNCTLYHVITCIIYRGSRSQVFYKIGFLKVSQHSQESTCAGALFLIKLLAWACNFIKKRLQHMKFSRITDLIEHLLWLLLTLDWKNTAAEAYLRHCQMSMMEVLRKQLTAKSYSTYL